MKKRNAIIKHNLVIVDTFRSVEERFGDHFHKVEVAAEYGQHITAAALGNGHVPLQEGRVAVLLDGILLAREQSIQQSI